MKYRWTETSIKQGLSCKIGSVRRVEPNPEEGILERYIEVELENEGPEDLQLLDLVMQGYSRVGGKTLPEAVAENIVLEEPNPQKEAYKLSALYGLTQAQLETYIENNVTNLAAAKEFLKKLSAVVLWLAKQNKMEA